MMEESQVSRGAERKGFNTSVKQDTNQFREDQKQKYLFLLSSRDKTQIYCGPVHITIKTR